MKFIAITVANADAIEAALRAINLKSLAHTFTTFAEVETIAARAEKEILALVGSKKSAVGAQYTAGSGASVPNAYKYNRTGTVLRLLRRTSGWYLVGVFSKTLHKGGGTQSITLTAEQSAKAIAEFATQWTVEPAPCIA